MLLIAIRHYSRTRRVLVLASSQCQGSRNSYNRFTPPKGTCRFENARDTDMNSSSSLYQNAFQKRKRTQSLVAVAITDESKISFAKIKEHSSNNLETKFVATKEPIQVSAIMQNILLSRRRSLDASVRCEVAAGKTNRKRVSTEWGNERSRNSCTYGEFANRLGKRRPSAHSRELSIALLQVCVSLLHVAISIPFSVAFPIYSTLFATLSLPVKAVELSYTSNVSTFIRKCVGLLHRTNFSVYMIQVRYFLVKIKILNLIFCK